MKNIAAADLEEIYQRLLSYFGPQDWWPGDTPFEVMVGAVLTQNTNWGNVEKAMAHLKKERLLTPEAIHKVSVKKLAFLIRPSGYFNVKAKRLKNLISFLMQEYQGDIKTMRREPLAQLREKLLDINGIGPETADSILLYALEKPVFVIDAYTRRFLYRHNFVGRDIDYHDLQNMFMRHLPQNVQTFNEFHALIVRLGKAMCKPTPSCQQCPLNNFFYSLQRRCHDCYRTFLDSEKPAHISSGMVCQDCCKKK